MTTNGMSLLPIECNVNHLPQSSWGEKEILKYLDFFLIFANPYSYFSDYGQ